MGVPIFAILLGFGVGWYAPAVLSGVTSETRQMLRVCLVAACLTSGFTFLLMLAIWGPTARMPFDPAADFVNFGIPMILYEPRASFIGWLVLMVVISPLLQGLTTGFTSSVRLAWRPPTSLRQPPHPVQRDCFVDPSPRLAQG
jgi:hypothetical protein